MSDLTLPPDYAPALSAAASQEINIVRLAREIAMDLRPVEQILEHHRVSREQFEQLKRHPYFDRVLRDQIKEWESAINTGERVRLKAQAAVEELLPELYKRVITPKEDLLKVTKGAELIVKLSGLGVDAKDVGDPSSRVQITINMGADNKIQVSKSLPPKVIDHEEPADELQQGLFELAHDSH